MAELTPSGANLDRSVPKAITAEQEIDLLGDGESIRLTYLFDENPNLGTRQVTVRAYPEP